MNNLNLDVEFCCTCLKVCSEKDKFLSLSFATHRELTYRNQLKFCVPEMGAEISLDSYICKPCSIALENAYKFRCMCLHNDSKLDSIRISQQKSLKDSNGIRDDLLNVLLKHSNDEKLPQLDRSLKASSDVPITFDAGGDDKAAVTRALGSLLSQSLNSTKTNKSNTLPGNTIPPSRNRRTRKRRTILTYATKHKKARSKRKALSDDEIVRLACKTNPQLRNITVESLDCRVSLEKIVIRELPVIIPSEQTNKRNNGRKRDPYYCNLCNKSLRQRDRYYSHILKHSNIRAYKCNLCPLKYFSSDSLRNHQKKAHNIIAGKIEPKVDPLRITIPKQTEKTPKKKSPQGKSNQSKCVLKIKMGKFYSVKNTNTDNLFSCSECTFQTPSRALYNQHTLEHLNTGKYVCEVCSKCFSSLSNKNKHKRNIHKNCSIGGKKKKKITVLPMQIKSEPTVDYEPVYNETPVYNEVPVYNEATVYNEPPVYSEAPVYNEAPIYNEAPVYNEEPIYNEEPLFNEEPVYSQIILAFKCETCGECFEDEDTCEVHKKIHIKKIEINGTTNNTNNQQKVKSRKKNSTTSNSNNQEVVKPKKKKKKFFCTVCDAEFASRDHGNIHTGNRPYSCNICAKTFAAYTTLRKHRNTHVNKNLPVAQSQAKQITIHKCEICKQEFTKASDAVSHTCKTSSGESVYRCQICKNAYLGRNALIDHMRMHLTETDETF